MIYGKACVFSKLLGAWGQLGANPLLGSSQAQAENKTVPTPRDRAEPLAPRVLPPIPRLILLLSHHRPLFLNLLRQPAWRFWQFSVFFLQGGGVVLWLFAFLEFWGLFAFGEFWLPPPPAACSARPAGVALKASPIFTQPQSTNGGTVTPDRN